MKKKFSVRLAATVGDPTSIGPEVASKALSKILKQRGDLQIFLFCPATVLSQNILRPFFKNGQLQILSKVRSTMPSSKFVPGKPSKRSASQALNDLKSACDFCLEGGAEALITGPVDKMWVSQVSPGFTGHTEFLQKRTGSKGSTMLLAGPSLKVALVTTHVPLREVAHHLNRQKIVETAQRTWNFLLRLKAKPRLAILGLNPHASDRGLIGNEEKLIIEPAIKRLRTLKILAEGPFSPDSFFAKDKGYDAVVCMYHDQGLIPLKMRHFYDAVNITLGLPFLRVSVDHGTAFDIAGKFRASYLSYAQAIETAYSWVKKSSQD